MDPALQELLERSTDPEEELEVIMRLRRAGRIPERTRVIASFGKVITCRIRRKHIREVYASPRKASMKAAREIGPVGQLNDAVFLPANEALPTRRNTSEVTGRGVVVAVIDTRFDLGHREYRRTDGSSRLIGYWHQGLTYNRRHGNKYGYGKMFTTRDIDAALASSNPYAVLGQHPGIRGSNSAGHGNHVAAIAAGSYIGEAPDADLVFVHMGGERLAPEHSFGDSVRLLEALDYCRTIAGDRKLVVNISMGRHGGPKDGTSLVARGMDAFIRQRRGTMICQSAGNYYGMDAHHAGCVFPGKRSKFHFTVPPNDETNNELEIWYSGRDSFRLELRHEPSGERFRPRLGGAQDIIIGGSKVGKLYHRRRDPNNGKNHIDLFLDKSAPAGEWRVVLSGTRIVDGNYHAYLERDALAHAAKFRPADVERKETIGSITAGHNSIVVGAHGRSQGIDALTFSSSGPTVDGRPKPDISAPGVRINSARTTAYGRRTPQQRYVRMSGTSMASPLVAGLCARILQQLPRSTNFYRIRQLVIGAARPLPASYGKMRRGAGKVSPENSIRLTRRHLQQRAARR